MRKITRIVICILILASVCVNTAIAFDVTPFADSEFFSVTALLSTRKDVSFSCSTYDIKETIKITS